MIGSLDNEFDGVLPEHDAPTHAALGYALGNVLGVAQPELFERDTVSAASKIVDLIGEPDHVVFLMLDGFGMNFVDRLPWDSYVRKHISMQLCSTLPTSTGPNLTSLATGRWPGAHGNLGWDVHVPRLGERIQPLTWRLTRTGQSLSEIGFSPMELLFTPLIPFRNLGNYTFVIKSELSSSQTTQMYGQTRTVAYSKDDEPISDIVDSVLAGIAGSTGKSFTYVYWTEVDSSAHQYGETHPITRAEVSRAVALMEALGTALEGEARFVATADHGHLDSPKDAWLTLPPSDSICQHLTCVPAGEPRAMFFHTKSGQERAFQEQFTACFGDHFVLLPCADAVDLGIFGPVAYISDASRARMGDFFALSRGRWSLYASEKEEAVTLQSMHGGITTAESIVPLIVI